MIYPDFEHEKSLIPSDCRYILGIDEVGRGPWAGPVTIGAFLIDIQNFDLNFFTKNKIRDSKLLSESQRQIIFSEFTKNNYIFKTFSATSAIKNLIIEAAGSFEYDFALVDGNYSLDIPKSLSVVKADTTCFSVASASICAKVVRDNLMDEFDSQYPVYGFKNHKGYGTAQHLSALKSHGPCPIHRRSYKPIKNLF